MVVNSSWKYFIGLLEIQPIFWFQVELLNLPDLETRELTKLNYTLILYTITLKFN